MTKTNEMPREYFNYKASFSLSMRHTALFLRRYANLGQPEHQYVIDRQEMRGASTGNINNREPTED